jgi:hypothetical protein
MRRSPTADDPRHFTTRDGRTMPVTGTHDDGEPCATCQRVPLRILASAYPLGALVGWKYGRHGLAHGRVIEHGRTRLRIFWHARRARDIWLSASRIEGEHGTRKPGCGECANGR